MDGKKICIKIIRRWCTGKVFIGDNDNKKEVDNG